MTDNRSQPPSQGKEITGPTINRFRLLLDDKKPVPVCADCPAAQWYKLDDGKGDSTLECFCTQFRGVMYPTTRGAVTACDARADALATSTPSAAD